MILTAYLLLGLVCAVRLVPWGQRFFYVARLRGDAWWVKLLGGLAVFAWVTVAWPLYLFAYWRSDALEALDAEDAQAARDLEEAIDEYQSRQD